MSESTKNGFGGGLFGKESQAVVDVYLNLTPLMDVMSNILFFLLAAFGASAVAVLAVTVPVDATSDPGTTPPDDKVTVTMRADATGVTLGCTSGTRTADDLKMCEVRLLKRGGEYDHTGLTSALKAIKQKFSGANTIVVVPNDELRYETIVKLLDASRDIKTSDGKRLLLFPDVVMSSLVK